MLWVVVFLAGALGFAAIVREARWLAAVHRRDAVEVVRIATASPSDLPKRPFWLRDAECDAVVRTCPALRDAYRSAPPQVLVRTAVSQRAAWVALLRRTGSLLGRAARLLGVLVMIAWVSVIVTVALWAVFCALSASSALYGIQ